MSGITLTEVSSGTIPTPSSGKATLYVDTTTGAYWYKDDSGAIRPLGSLGFYELTDAATINTDCNNGVNFHVTLGGNRTLANPTNMKDGVVYNWYIEQDGTGSRTLAYGSKFKFSGGTPTLSTAAGARDFISAIYNSTDDIFLAVAALDFT